MPLTRQEIQRRYRERNRLRLREIHRRYRLRHPERIKQNHRKWLENNRQTHNERNSIWQKNNRDKCNVKLKLWRFRNPERTKEQNKKNDILFKGKRIGLKLNPRIGQCCKCLRKIGEGIKRTCMHHIEYHEDDPLEDTIELCNSCHRKEHIKLERE